MSHTDTLIETLLADSVNGLIPRLEQDLGESFGRFQIRPWSFSGVFEGSGYRITEIVNERPRHGTAGTLSFEIRIGFLIQVTDEAEAQIQGAKLAVTIDEVVFHWSDCSIANSIPIVGGAIQARQDKNLSSSWYVVVVREAIIELDYYL